MGAALIWAGGAPRLRRFRRNECRPSGRWWGGLGRGARAAGTPSAPVGAGESSLVAVEQPVPDDERQPPEQGEDDERGHEEASGPEPGRRGGRDLGADEGDQGREDPTPAHRRGGGRGGGLRRRQVHGESRQLVAEARGEGG